MREAGHKNLDTHTPYPVHGIEEALGLKRAADPDHRSVRGHRRGVHRVLDDLLHETWSTSRSTSPTGRPTAPPANIPITFELAVLLGGTSSFFGLMALMRLPQPYHPVFESDAFRARLHRRLLPLGRGAAGEDPDRAVADEPARARRRVEIVEEPSDDRRLSSSLRGAAPARGLACDENILNPMADRQPPGTTIGRATSTTTASRCSAALAPCRASDHLNPPLTTGRQPTGQWQPNGERCRRT